MGTAGAHMALFDSFSLLVLAVIQVAGATLALTSIFLLRKKTMNGFDRLVYFAAIFMLVHICNAFISQQFFYHESWLDVAPPFGLMYGPLFYFVFLAAAGNGISLRKILIHTGPFVLYQSAMLVMYVSPDFRNAIYGPYILSLYLGTCVSMIVYTVWGLLVKGTEGQGHLKNFISTMALLLVFIAFVMLLAIYNYAVPDKDINPTSFAPVLIYAAILCVLWYMFQHSVNRLLPAGAKESAVMDKGREEVAAVMSIHEPDDEEEHLPQYHKSALAPKVLDDYVQKLERLMTEKMLYLDAELSLPSLAREMKIPKHHLSQLLSKRIGKNFSQYVNQYRVEHACRMLSVDVDQRENLEDLAVDCGFSSKTSFNRCFKAHTGHTPSEYRSFGVVSKN